MLLRKMLREIKGNIGQYLSIMILAFLALAMFCTMAGHVLGQNKARTKLHKACNLADLWIYGEGFTQENLDAIEALDFVKDVQLRMSVTGSAPDYDGAQVDVYLERENLVNKPYYISGEEFDPSDTEGVWLTNAFARVRNIKIGDNFTIEYNGIQFTRVVKGLIESAEYEFRQAEGDADVYIENIAFVYMSYDAFPIREYVNRLIENGTITVQMIKDETDLLDEKIEALEELGISISNITQEDLLALVKKTNDEVLKKMLPYTQMVITTSDGLALEHEKEIQNALLYNYSAIVDEHSIPGVERLNSELAQHRSFSYLFIIIFVGITVLVIATAMNRMVEKQRTQIGTMNALGMKRYKIILHYISYSFFTSLIGCVIAIWVGSAFLAPFLADLFANYYIVPGLKVGFDITYVWIAFVVVAVCTLTSLLSCRKILRIKPAEALRPAPPKQGKNCLFERLPFWKHLSFNAQYNLRDISRSKLRAFMGVVGTGVGMLLMVYGIACNGLLDDIVERNFNKVQVADYQLSFSESVSETFAENICKDTSGELVMIDMIEIARNKDAVSDQKKKETITVLEGKGLYNVIDVDANVIEITAGSVGMSRKLCADMGLSIGDTFYWHIYSENKWYEATVGFIYQSSESQGIVYLRDDYEEIGAKYVPNMLYSNKNLSSYLNEETVTAVYDKTEMIDAYRNSMSVISIMVWMMIGFSSVLIVVVLYNSGNLSFFERVKEFATLKVLGLQSKRIRRILTVQNIWLSIIGIIIGAPFGKVTLNQMMNSNGENFDYNLNIEPYVYLISGILVLVISMLVSFLFSKRIKNIDMVDVLKGAE